MGMESKVKTTHIILETVIGILSSLAFFPLSKNTEHFNDNCLLNANIYVTRHNNESVSLDLTKTTFGDLDDCNYTTFLNVVVAMHALIWIWFFFHLDDLRSHKGSSVNLLMPALLSHFILFLCAMVSSSMITSGFSSWCDHIQANNHMRLPRTSCKDYESLPWTEYRSSFYSYNELALVSSWLIVACLLVSMVMTCVHLYWDFMDTCYVPGDKAALETSGYSDNGVGILNKTYSTDGFFSSSLESMSYSYNRAAEKGGNRKPRREYYTIDGVNDDGGASVDNVSGGGGGGGYQNGAGNNMTDSSPDGDPVVSATVHAPSSASRSHDDGDNVSSGLRSRGAINNKHDNDS